MKEIFDFICEIFEHMAKGFGLMWEGFREVFLSVFFIFLALSLTLGPLLLLSLGLVKFYERVFIK